MVSPDCDIGRIVISVRHNLVYILNGPPIYNIDHTKYNSIPFTYQKKQHQRGAFIDAVGSQQTGRLAVTPVGGVS